MPYNSETETFYQAPATVVDSTPDGDTVQEGFDDRLTPAMAGLYDDLNLLKADGMISVGIPATTTARGIGRVATAADVAVGSTITNGPAFLDAATWKVSATPAANGVVQASASGKIDEWVSDASSSVAGKTKKNDAVSSTGQDAATQKCAYDTANSVTTSQLGAAFRQLQGGNSGPGGMVGNGGIGSSLCIGTNTPTLLPAGGTWWVFFLGCNPSGAMVLDSVRVYCVPGGQSIGTSTTSYIGFAIRIA